MVRRNLPPVFQGDASHPMLDDFTLRSERHRVRQHPMLPLVGELPVRDNAMWTGNVEIGKEISYADLNIQALNTVVNSTMVLKLGTWGPPQVWTVLLGAAFDAAAQTSDQFFNINCEAQIGCGGTVQTINIDWKNGASFSAPMNSLVLTATFPNTSGGAIPTDLVLKAQVGIGGRGNVYPATKTIESSIESAIVAPQNVLVPPYAERVWLQGAILSGTATTIYDPANNLRFFDEYDTGVTTAYANIAANLIPSFSQGIPLSNKCRRLQYENNLGAGVLDSGVLTYIFGLSV